MEVIIGIFAFAVVLIIFSLMASVAIYISIAVVAIATLVVLLPFDLLLYPIVKEKFPISRLVFATLETWPFGGPSKIDSNIRNKILASKSNKRKENMLKKSIEERIYCEICEEAYFSHQALEIHMMMRHAKEMEV